MSADPDDVPLTGDDDVDTTLSRLADIDPTAPPEHHLPVLAEVHEALQRRLTAAAE